MVQKARLLVSRHEDLKHVEATRKPKTGTAPGAARALHVAAGQSHPHGTILGGTARKVTAAAASVDPVLTLTLCDLVGGRRFSAASRTQQARSCEPRLGRDQPRTIDGNWLRVPRIPSTDLSSAAGLAGEGTLRGKAGRLCHDERPGSPLANCPGIHSLVPSGRPQGELLSPDEPLVGGLPARCRLGPTAGTPWYHARAFAGEPATHPPSAAHGEFGDDAIDRPHPHPHHVRVALRPAAHTGALPKPHPGRAPPPPTFQQPGGGGRSGAKSRPTLNRPICRSRLSIVFRCPPAAALSAPRLNDSAARRAGSCVQSAMPSIKGAKTGRVMVSTG